MYSVAGDKIEPSKKKIRIFENLYQPMNTLHFEDLHNSVNKHFLSDQCLVLQN